MSYLKHHGILGQKWGERNGPPYPLDSDQKSSAEKKHYNVNVKDVKRNMDQMSDDELRKAINRINMQNQVNSMSPDTITAGINRINKRATTFNTLAKNISTTYAWTTKISKYLAAAN